MKVTILGAGILGVTTAYFLNKRGYDVTVIDRQSESGAECSFANGGQLSYSHAEPWATPQSLKKSIKWIGKKDAPLLFNFRLDWHMWIWSFKFMLQCRDAKVKINTKKLLRLGLYSRKIMHEIDDDVDIDFDYQKKGKLFIFENQKDFDLSLKQTKLQNSLGGNCKRLSAQECLDKEPTLSHIKNKIIGGIYDAEDESGDVHKFCVEMSKLLMGKGVKFQYDTTIKSIKTKNNQIIAIETDKGDIESDKYVMALGSYSSVHLRKIGINVPIYPMKGYSISIKVEDESKIPDVSITHSKQKIVFSRLGDVLRVAGTAEFAGYDDSLNDVRIEMLKRDAKEIFPDCGDVENADEWACLRPSTPDGPPILGKCRYENLYLNTGHGTLGWTQCAASAKIVTDIIDDKEPEISIDGLTIDRYL